MTSEHESLIYAKVASVALKQKNLEGMKIICIVHFLYSFFNIVLEVFMKSKICLAKSRFGVSQCFAFVLSKENEPKVKDPFAEEFFAVGKNRSKTPRRYAPVFGAFQRIFCTSGFSCFAREWVQKYCKLRRAGPRSRS